MGQVSVHIYSLPFPVNSRRLDWSDMNHHLIVHQGHIRSLKNVLRMAEQKSHSIWLQIKMSRDLSYASSYTKLNYKHLHIVVIESLPIKSLYGSWRNIFSSDIRHTLIYKMFFLSWVKWQKKFCSDGNKRCSLLRIKEVSKCYI